MDAIISFIFKMLPFMAAVVPVFIIIRFIVYKTGKNKKINLYHEIFLLIFVMFAVGLASQTIIPKWQISESGALQIINGGTVWINVIPFKVFSDTYTEVFLNGNITYFTIQFLGNIIMFMPIGFFIPMLWEVSNRKVVLIGFLSSLFIELSQLFIGRGTDIDDIILNTSGVALGLLVYRLFFKKFKSSIEKCRC